MANHIESAPSAQENTQEQLETIATDNFKDWNIALQSNDPHEVARLYSKKNTFHPTASGELKQGRAKAEGYFRHFQERDPKGDIIITKKVEALSDDVYLHTGEYDFDVATVDKKGRTVIHADFTYVWGKNKAGEWQILHHHSSAKKAETQTLEDFLRGEILEKVEQKLTKNTILRSGIYKYTKETDEGHKEIVARFTEIFQDDKRIHLHLSERPEG